MSITGYQLERGLHEGTPLHRRIILDGSFRRTIKQAQWLVRDELKRTGIEWDIRTVGTPDQIPLSGQIRDPVRLNRIRRYIIDRKKMPI